MKSHMTKIDRLDIDKFWARVAKAGDEDCWPWKAGKTGAGYGVFYVKDGARLRPVSAHRFSLMLTTGRMPKAFALHSCDNPACCNPAHLRWGAQRENVQDALARKRHVPPPNVRANPEWEASRISALPRGEDHPNAKIAPSDVSEIYRSRLSGQDFRSIAAKLNLNPTTVSDICNGVAWRHCLGKDGNPTLDQLKAIPPKNTPGAKITPEIAAAIKTGLANGETGRALATKFGIHFATVSDIKRGLIWKDA